MLSVSMSGYDNDYGQMHTGLHCKNDLAVLKKHELLITVRGGEHVGMLYWLLVCLPASLNTNTQMLYEFILDVFVNDDPGSHLEKYSCFWQGLDDNMGSDTVIDFYNRTRMNFHNLRSEIIEICNVMINNYQIFIDHVWDASEKAISEYANELQNTFDESEIIKQFDELMRRDNDNVLFASLVNSIHGGAEAIDVSQNQHVFGIGNYPNEFRCIMSQKEFILHEYVIFMLKQRIDFPDNHELYLKQWKYIESLAAFFKSKILIDTDKCRDDWTPEYIIDFYKEIYSNNPRISPVELLESALEHFEK